MDRFRLARIQSEMDLVEKVLADAPEIDRRLGVSKDEFKGRQKKVWQAVQTVVRCGQPPGRL